MQENSDDELHRRSGGLLATAKSMNATMTEPSEAHATIHSRSSNILTSWKQLNEILIRYEDSIRNRWMDQTPAQRWDTLRYLWPKKPPSRHYRLEAFHRSTKGIGAQTQRIGTPSCGLTSIRKTSASTNPMLLLLNSHGRHHPSRLAALDGESLHLAYASSVIKSVAFGPTAMRLNGVESMDPEEYGRVGDVLKDGPGVVVSIMRGNQFEGGIGYHILEIQERLLSFLVQFAVYMLRDVEPAGIESSVSAKYRAEAVEPLAVIERGTVRSLELMVLETPYCLPEINFGQLAALLEAREAVAEDHIWSMREDPGYFAEEVSNFQGSAIESSMVTTETHAENAIKSLRNKSPSTFVASAIAEAYISLELCTELRAQAQQ